MHWIEQKSYLSTIEYTGERKEFDVNITEEEINKVKITTEQEQFDPCMSWNGVFLFLIADRRIYSYGKHNKRGVTIYGIY